MLHKEIAGLSILFFILWVFVAGSGSARIQRVCAPVDWTGNVILSAAALASPDSQVPLTKTMDKVVYGCEYVFWRLFYQDTYLEWAQTRGKELGIAQPALPGGEEDSGAASSAEDGDAEAGAAGGSEKPDDKSAADPEKSPGKAGSAAPAPTPTPLPDTPALRVIE